jgi:uncharacterized protein YbjT (DUF2867 family)
MILVTGATGMIGRTLVGQLDEQDVAFRATSRSRDQENSIPHLVTMDFADPASIAEALDGTDVVFLNTAQHPDMAALQGNVVDVAKGAGVGHIVKLSAGNAFVGHDSRSWVGRAHTEIEDQIFESGLGWTILRPRFFMQNLLGFAGPISEGTLPMPLPDQHIAPVDTRDIAAVAAAVLTAPGDHDERIYDLSGPESVSFDDLAQRFSDTLGTNVTHVSPPLSSVAAAAAATGAPEWMQRHRMEGMEIHLTDGTVGEVSPDVERVTGRRATDVDTFIADHKAIFGG